jgi:hypothetical protein
VGIVCWFERFQYLLYCARGVLASRMLRQLGVCTTEVNIL